MSVTKGKRRRIHDRDGGVCHYCGDEDVPLVGGTVDHVWPRFYGGSDDDWNLVWSCAYCNDIQGHDTDKCDCAFCKRAQAQHLRPQIEPHLSFTIADALEAIR